MHVYVCIYVYMCWYGDWSYEFCFLAMWILSLHLWNTSINIQIGDDLTSKIFERFIEWQKHTFLQVASVFRGRGNVLGEEDVLYMVHGNPSGFLCTFLWVPHDVLRLRISCILSIFNQYKSCRHGTYTAVSSFHVGCCMRQRNPSFFVPCAANWQDNTYKSCLHNPHNVHYG
jgi:hypothetical protein